MINLSQLEARLATLNLPDCSIQEVCRNYMGEVEATTWTGRAGWEGDETRELSPKALSAVQQLAYELGLTAYWRADEKGMGAFVFRPDYQLTSHYINCHQQGGSLTTDQCRVVYRYLRNLYCGEYTDGEGTHDSFHDACQRRLKSRTPADWVTAALATVPHEYL